MLISTVPKSLRLVVILPALSSSALNLLTRKNLRDGFPIRGECSLVNPKINSIFVGLICLAKIILL